MPEAARGAATLWFFIHHTPAANLLLTQPRVIYAKMPQTITF